MGATDGQGSFIFPVLVGDVGGTNARFALVENPESPARLLPIVQTADFANIDDAIRGVVLAAGERPLTMILAIAGPVAGDEIPLTNCPWVVRPKVIIRELDFEQVLVLNDFEAQALAVVALDSSHMLKIGGDQPIDHAARVVLGPGTGLGVAGLIQHQGVWIPIPGEGGHMDLGPRTPRDFEIFPHVEKLEGRISGEQMLCGRGLLNCYRAVAAADGVTPVLDHPAQVTAAALGHSDPIAVEALDLFATCLGRTAGDLAMVFMAKGGVYLTGGIAQKIMPALTSGKFRAAFEDKAPHSKWLAKVPAYVITHPLAAVEGLAAYARDPSHFGVETGTRSWQA
jgi:glucokinase